MEGMSSHYEEQKMFIIENANQKDIDQIAEAFGKLSHNELNALINRANQRGKNFLQLEMPDGTKQRLRPLNDRDAQAIFQKNPEMKEIFEKGMYVLEQKQKSGNRIAIAGNEKVAQQVAQGSIQFRGSSGNVKQYSNVQTMTKQQQASIAKAFTKAFGGVEIALPEKKATSASFERGVEAQKETTTASYKPKGPHVETKPKEKETKKETTHVKTSTKADLLQEEEALQRKKAFRKTEKSKDEASEERIQKQKDIDLKRGETKKS